MTVVLHDRLKAAPQYLFECRSDHALLPRRFTVADIEKVVDAVTEFEIAIAACLSSLCHFPVTLHHEIVAHLGDRQQALQAGIHVAVEGIIFEAHNAVLEVG